MSKSLPQAVTVVNGVESIIPTRNHLCVREITQTHKTKSGLIVLDGEEGRHGFNREKPILGEIIAIGPDIHQSFNIGDHIFFSKHGPNNGKEFFINSQTVYVIMNLDVMGMYNQDTEFFTPIYDRVLIERTPLEQKTDSGVYLAPTEEKNDNGVIISVGDGMISKSGVFIPTYVKPGMKVMWEKLTGSHIMLNDKDYVIMRDSDILAVMEE